MAIPTFKGTLSTPVMKVRRMVSLSEEFQSQAGVSTADDALKHISITRRDEDRIKRPFACVMLGDSHTYRQVSGGSQNHLVAGGSVGLYMTIDTNPEYKLDFDSASIEAANFFGTVIDEVVALSGADDAEELESHLPVSNVTQTLFGDSDDGHEETVGRFFWTVYLLDWGFN